MSMKIKPEDQWSCKRLPDYWPGITTTMKQVAQRATMLTCEPLYKARKNGNINFSDA